MNATDRWQRVAFLRRSRPKDAFLRISFILLAVIFVGAWLSPELQPGRIDWDRRLANGSRFLNKITPWPLTKVGEETGLFTKFGLLDEWARDLMRREGWEATFNTLAFSISAIVLAGLLTAIHLPLAARSLATPEPFVTAAPRFRQKSWPLWLLARQGSRVSLMLWRAIPEYMLAFFLVSAFGLNAWPAVLALALHNLGIVGRLTSELVENLPTRLPEAQRAIGASRLQILGFAAVPALLPRFLVYFFYRWETCVRDATVLGMLGIASLGYAIVEARAHDRFDEMIFFVGLGSLLVLLGDFASLAVRRWAKQL